MTKNGCKKKSPPKKGFCLASWGLSACVRALYGLYIERCIFRERTYLIRYTCSSPASTPPSKTSLTRCGIASIASLTYIVGGKGVTLTLATVGNGEVDSTATANGAAETAWEMRLYSFACESRKSALGCHIKARLRLYGCLRPTTALNLEIGILAHVLSTLDIEPYKLPPDNTCETPRSPHPRETTCKGGGLRRLYSRILPLRWNYGASGSGTRT